MHNPTRTWLNSVSVGFSIAEGFPEPCDDSGAERLRQAFVGYDNLPRNTEKQPLRLHVHDFEDKLHLGVNEFQILLNCLPVANVCIEARAHAANFCRDRIKVVEVIYTKEPPSCKNEVLEHIFLRPTAVVVTIPYQPLNEFARFKSANCLVEVVSCIFGNSIGRLILNFWFDAHNDFENIYWPHMGKTRILHQADPI